jgi:Protein of unknown function (DUF3592)
MPGFRQPSGEVPAAPRTITPDIERDCSARGRVFRIFAMVYGILSGPLLAGAGLGMLVHLPALALALLPMGLFFGLGGAIAGWLGWRAKQHALLAYRDGVECRATVVDVLLDRKVRVNGKSPWRVRYEFETPNGRGAKGTATFWAQPVAEVGQEVIALYDPERPSHNVLWTRLDALPEAPKLRVATEQVSVTEEVSAPTPAEASTESSEDDAADEPLDNVNEGARRRAST